MLNRLMTSRKVRGFLLILLICAMTISSLLIIGAVVKFISARKGKKG